MAAASTSVPYNKALQYDRITDYVDATVNGPVCVIRLVSADAWATAPLIRIDGNVNYNRTLVAGTSPATGEIGWSKTGTGVFVLTDSASNPSTILPASNGARTVVVTASSGGTQTHAVAYGTRNATFSVFTPSTGAAADPTTIYVLEIKVYANATA